MKALAPLLALALIAVASVTWSSDEPTADEIAAGRFVAVSVYLDSADEPLAAYQFHLRDREGGMRVVGVEGGDHPAFAEAPYFDREAVDAGRADRIIVAAYSTQPADALPRGRSRIATIHVHLTGDTEPQWQLELIQAGNAAGEPIEATLTLDRPGYDTNQE